MAVRLILTHENADFDAVAAQLAAHKLDPAALPVLPRRLNSNVRDFWTLYRSALPHVQVDELPRGTVQAVTVVDTQNVITLKGMRAQTPARIIDHHPPRDPLPSHHIFSGEPLGATTTLLVEQIRAADLSLAPLEATLLALGIYEDTGSLLYGTTTARDIAAAAWLVEQGADLDVVRRFLQQPLNEGQQRLYDLLLADLVVREIHGHSVVIAAARLDGNVDQVATVAHKLRDTLDPSALFVLVQMGARLQVVARSTVDEIDVGRILRRLGGGGHGRAAAALIETGDLDETRTQLETLLETMIQPMVKVADLMSRRIKTIAADEPIRAAARLMHRTGHEGYPVLNGRELVGLLTRRSVDRAMSHNMGDQPVSQIMESGRVVVHPNDSLHYLQQQMMRSGWGQIPVVDDEGTLVGIVTRTDLINRWGQPADGAVRRAEIVRRLERALSPALWALLRGVSQQAQQMGLGLYGVGGFVRDLLLARPNADIDLVVEGDAIALVQALVARYGGSMRKHTQFGTATWLLDGQVAQAFGGPAGDWPTKLDFVTARAEFYETPTALPTVTQGSIKLDLHRRDFSINTLAIRLSPEPLGQLLDFWGGERDLQDGMIRVLHSLSFIDDPTRILRAARFEQRFGFRIEARTLSLIERALPLLDRVSGPRLKHEIELILREERPERVFGRLQALGVLAYLSPQIVVDDWFYAAFEAIRYLRQSLPWPGLETIGEQKDGWSLPFFVVLTCRFDPAEAERLGRRLQVRRPTLEEMLSGVRSYREIVPALQTQPRPSQAVRLLRGLTPSGLAVAWAIAPTQPVRAQIAHYASVWQAVRPTMTREEIRALGIVPGPAYGRLLRRLRDAWLDGEVQSSAEERDLAARLVADGWETVGGSDG